MTQPPVTSSSQEPMSSYVPEGLPATSPADESSPLLPQIMMLTANALARLIAELCLSASEPRLPEMSAKAHLTALNFDEDPANLQSFFTELEHHFTQCQIRDNIVPKKQCLHYLNAMITNVWASDNQLYDLCNHHTSPTSTAWYTIPVWFNIGHRSPSGSSSHTHHTPFSRATCSCPWQSAASICTRAEN